MPTYMTRHELLETLFTIKGQPLQTRSSGCTDTSPAQEPVWYTAAVLNIVQPSGACVLIHTLIEQKHQNYLLLTQRS